MQFFISYATPNRSIAEWIATTLEDAHYTVWLAPVEILVGQVWTAELQEALNNADKLIAVISQAYFQSEWTQTEYATFLGDDPIGKKRLILQVLIDDIELPRTYRTRQSVRLQGMDDEARKALLHAVDPKKFPPVAPSVSISDDTDRPPSFRVTSPDRLFWTKPGVIRLEFLEQYARIVVRIAVPHEKLLVSGPSLIAGKSEFHFHFAPDEPRVRTIQIRSAEPMDAVLPVIVSCFGPENQWLGSEELQIEVTRKRIFIALAAALLIAAIYLALRPTQPPGDYFKQSAAGNGANKAFWSDTFNDKGKSRWNTPNGWQETREPGSGGLVATSPGLATTWYGLDGGKLAFFNFGLQLHFQIQQGNDFFWCLRAEPQTFLYLFQWWRGYVFHLSREKTAGSSITNIYLRGYRCPSIAGCMNDFAHHREPPAQLSTTGGTSTWLDQNGCDDADNSSFQVMQDSSVSDGLFDFRIAIVRKAYSGSDPCKVIHAIPNSVKFTDHEYAYGSVGFFNTSAQDAWRVLEVDLYAPKQ